MKKLFIVFLLLFIGGCGVSSYQIEVNKSDNSNPALEKMCQLRGHVADNATGSTYDSNDEVIDRDSASYLIHHLGVVYHYKCLRCGAKYNRFKSAYSDTTIVWVKK